MSITRDQFEMLKKLPLFKSKIVSDSMVPILNIGDEIVIDIGYKDIKRFDIIVIYLDEKLVCHYLWRMNKFVKPILLQTRNMSGKLDYPITLDNYLGKVVSHKLGLWQKLRIIF